MTKLPIKQVSLNEEISIPIVQLELRDNNSIEHLVDDVSCFLSEHLGKSIGAEVDPDYEQPLTGMSMGDLPSRGYKLTREGEKIGCVAVYHDGKRFEIDLREFSADKKDQIRVLQEYVKRF